MLFVFIGYSFSVIIFGHSVLSHLQNNKEALLNAFTVPLLYFPILVIASILLYSRLTTQIANAEEERRAKNPKYKAEEALNLLHQGLPTGYPQTPTRPNFLLKLSNSYCQRLDTYAKQTKNVYVNKKQSTLDTTYNIAMTNEQLPKITQNVETEENQPKDKEQTNFPLFTEMPGHQENIKAKQFDETPVDQCQLCFDAMPDAVILECGHSGICFLCSLKLLCSSGVCHMCRHKVEQVVRLDMNYNDPTFMKVIEGVNGANISHYINMLKILKKKELLSKQAQPQLSERQNTV